jgi:hypothetical protein
MKIILYRSALCPRCHFARKALIEIATSIENIELEEIDVFSNPLRAWSDGIRVFPALKIGDRVLGHIFLTREKMEKFINECLDNVKHY